MTTPREDAIAALRSFLTECYERGIDPDGEEVASVAAFWGLVALAPADPTPEDIYRRGYGDGAREVLGQFPVIPADPTADPEEAAFDAETAALHDWLTLAVEHMDAKVQPERYRPDGTIDRYSIDDTTWHRVLAIARGQVSDNAKRVLTANADAFFARRAALAAMRETGR